MNGQQLKEKTIHSLAKVKHVSSLRDRQWGKNHLPIYHTYYRSDCMDLCGNSEENQRQSFIQLEGM
jgi:hypothetical protein